MAISCVCSCMLVYIEDISEKKHTAMAHTVAKLKKKPIAKLIIAIS